MFWKSFRAALGIGCGLALALIIFAFVIAFIAAL